MCVCLCVFNVIQIIIYDFVFLFFLFMQFMYKGGGVGEYFCVAVFNLYHTVRLLLLLRIQHEIKATTTLENFN